AYLLIEQRLLYAAIHPRVIAEGKLAQVARPGIQLQHLLQKSLPVPRTRLHHLPLAEDQPYALDGAPLVRRGNRERDHPVGAILDRPCKELTAGEVALPVAVDEYSAFDGERQI